jgi:hypothetical protein
MKGVTQKSPKNLISISTVSKSLRNSPEIGEDTRKEITRRSFTITDLTCPKFKEQKDKSHRNNYAEIVHHFLHRNQWHRTSCKRKTIVSSSVYLTILFYGSS